MDGLARQLSAATGWNARADWPTLAERFQRERRVRVPDFLPTDAAQALYANLRQREDWRQLVNSGDKLFELDRPTREGMQPPQVRALDDAVYAGARAGFQYRYETIRVPDAAGEREASPDPLAAFAHWMSTGPARDALRTLTGFQSLDYVDAQATAYGPGDFLTAHDDDFAGKNRLAAYVLALSPIWRTEWGGILLFHDDAHASVSGMVPLFNTLNIFAVPQMHSVSEVTRAAAHRRYAITGWLRYR